MVLVDSTVWIDLLRRSETAPVKLLRRLLDLSRAAVTPVIVQEILQGTVDAAAFAKLHKYFGALPVLSVENPLELHIAAAKLYARARWRGITPRSPHDCLIAAVAIEQGIPLLHDDRDFEQLAAIEPKLKLLTGR